VDDQQLTVKEAALRLGVTTRTVRLWVEAGKLSAQRVRGKFGPEWRVSADGVEHLLPEANLGAVVSDPARKLGGNAFLAGLGALSTELEASRDAHEAHTQHIVAIADALGALRQELGTRPDPAQLIAGLVSQGSALQRALQEEARLRRRESQETLAGLQALTGLVQAQSEQLEALSQRIEDAAKPHSWWHRFFH
jgi:excisionase family DNA binding protein